MATDYMRGYNPNQSTGTGWSDYTFTEEDIKRFEEMGYDPRSALEAGYSAEEIIETMQEIEAERGGGLSPEGEYVNPQAIEEEKAIQAYKDEREAVMPTPQSAPVQAPLDSMREPPPEFEGLTDSRRWGFDENVEWSDYAKTGGSAFTSLLGEGIGFLLEGAGKRFDLPELVDGGKYIRERSKQVTDTIQETISPAAQQHMYGPRSLFKFKNEGDLIPESWGNFDLETLLLLGSSGVGSSAAILAPGAGIGRAATALTGGRLPGSIAGAVGMGTAGGALEGANTAAQVYDGLKAVDRETLVKSPMYKTAREEIIKQFPNATDERIEEFVREQIATQAAWETGKWTGAFIGLTSAWPGSLLGRTGFFGGNVKDKYRQGLAKSFYKGGKAESIQEFFQEGGQQLAINYGDYLAGKELQPFNLKGVTEAGATGAVAGGPIGGVAQSVSDLALERKPRPDIPEEEIPTGKAGELEEERKEAEKQLTEEAKAKPKVVNKKLRVLNEIKERIDNGEFKDEVVSFPPDIIEAARKAGVKGLETKTNPTATLADIMATNNITESDLLEGQLAEKPEDVKDTTDKKVTTTDKAPINVLDALNKSSGKINVEVDKDNETVTTNKNIIKNQYKRQIEFLKKYKDPDQAITEEEWKEFARETRRSPSLEKWMGGVASEEQLLDWANKDNEGSDYDVDVTKKAIASMSDEEIVAFAGGEYSQVARIQDFAEAEGRIEGDDAVDQTNQVFQDIEEETVEEETVPDEDVDAERKRLKQALSSANAVISKQEKNLNGDGTKEKPGKIGKLKQLRVQRSKVKNKAEQDRLDAVISKQQDSVNKTKDTIKRKKQEKAKIESRLAELPDEQATPKTKQKLTETRPRKKKDETKVEEPQPEPEPEPKTYDLVERKLFFGVGKYFPKKKVPKAVGDTPEPDFPKLPAEIKDEDYGVALELYEKYKTNAVKLVERSDYKKGLLDALAKEFGVRVGRTKFETINNLFDWFDKNYHIPIEVIPSEEDRVRMIISDKGNLRKGLDRLIPRGMHFRLLDQVAANKLRKRYQKRIKELERHEIETALLPSEVKELERLKQALADVGGVPGKLVDENGNEMEVFFTSKEYKQIIKVYRMAAKNLMEKRYNSEFSNIHSLFRLLTHRDSTIANRAKVMLAMEWKNIRQMRLSYKETPASFIGPREPRPRDIFMGKDGHLLEAPFGILQDDVDVMYSRIVGAIEDIEKELEGYAELWKETGVAAEIDMFSHHMLPYYSRRISTLERRLTLLKEDKRIIEVGADRPDTLSKSAEYKRLVDQGDTKPSEYTEYKRHKNKNFVLDSNGQKIPIKKVQIYIPTGQVFESVYVYGYKKPKLIKYKFLDSNLAIFGNVQKASRKYETIRKNSQDILVKMSKRQSESIKKFKATAKYKKLSNDEKSKKVNNLLGSQKRLLEKKKNELLLKHSVALKEFNKVLKDNDMADMSSVIRPDNLFDIEMDEELTANAKKIMREFTEQLKTLSATGWIGLYQTHGIYKDPVSKKIMDKYLEDIHNPETGTGIHADTYDDLSLEQIAHINSLVDLGDGALNSKAYIYEELGGGRSSLNPTSGLYNDSNSTSIDVMERAWERNEDGSYKEDNKGNKIPIMEVVLEPDTLKEEVSVFKKKTKKLIVYARDDSGKVIRTNVDGTINPAGTEFKIESEEEIVVRDEGGNVIMEVVKELRDTGIQNPDARPQFQREVKIEYTVGKKVYEKWIDEDTPLKKKQRYVYSEEELAPSPLRNALEKRGDNLSDPDDSLKYNKIYRDKLADKINEEQEAKWSGTGYLMPKMQQKMEMVTRIIPQEAPRFTYLVRATGKEVTFKNKPDSFIGPREVDRVRYTYKSDNTKKVLENKETIEVLGPIQKEVKRIESAGGNVGEWLEIEIDKDSGFEDIQIRENPVYFMKDGQVMQRFIGIGKKKYTTNALIDALAEGRESWTKAFPVPFSEVPYSQQEADRVLFRQTLEEIQKKVEGLASPIYFDPKGGLAIKGVEVSVSSDYQKDEELTAVVEAQRALNVHKSNWGKILGVDVDTGERVSPGVKISRESKQRLNKLHSNNLNRKPKKENRIGWTDRVGGIQTELVYLPQGNDFFVATEGYRVPIGEIRKRGDVPGEAGKIFKVSRMYVKDQTSDKINPNPKMYVQNPETGEYKEITEEWLALSNFSKTETQKVKTNFAGRKDVMRSGVLPLQQVKINVERIEAGITRLDFKFEDGTMEGAYLGTVSINHEGKVINRWFEKESVDYFGLTSGDINLLIGRSTGIYVDTLLDTGKKGTSIVDRYERLVKSLTKEERAAHDVTMDAIAQQEHAQSMTPEFKAEYGIEQIESFKEEAWLMQEDGYTFKVDPEDISPIGSVMVKLGVKKEPLAKWMKTEEDVQIDKKIYDSVKGEAGSDVEIKPDSEKAKEKVKEPDINIESKDPQLLDNESITTAMEYVSFVKDKQKNIIRNTKNQDYIKAWYQKKHNKVMTEGRLDALTDLMEGELENQAFRELFNERIRELKNIKAKNKQKITVDDIDKVANSIINNEGKDWSDEQKTQALLSTEVLDGESKKIDAEIQATLKMLARHSDDYHRTQEVFGKEDAKKLVQLYKGADENDSISTKDGVCKRK